MMEKIMGFLILTLLLRTASSVAVRKHPGSRWNEVDYTDKPQLQIKMVLLHLALELSAIRINYTLFRVIQWNNSIS